jgi:hypothetical protein
METLDIPQVEKQYQDEWLLFEVYEVDEQDRPIRGKLLARSPSRAALHEFLQENPCHDWYITYTGEKPKKGMAVVL